MSTWQEMDARDKVVVIIAAIIGLFAILSLIGVFVLALLDKPGTDEVWGRVFDLIAVLAGGLVGFIAGQSVEKAKIKKELSPGGH